MGCARMKVELTEAAHAEFSDLPRLAVVGSVWISGTGHVVRVEANGSVTVIYRDAPGALPRPRGRR